MNDILTATQAAEQLHIKLSTLRSYSNLFENNGYTFQRDTSNRRQYRISDMSLIREFISLIYLEKITKEIAIQQLLGTIDEPSINSRHVSDIYH